jgi:hypothetical protein
MLRELLDQNSFVARRNTRGARISFFGAPHAAER